jgi:hypothetical protein
MPHLLAGLSSRSRLALIACSPRTGSTLLQRILDSHSKIAAPCELPLLRYFPVDDPRRPAIAEKMRRICDYYGLDPAAAEAKPLQFLEEIRKRESKQLVVVKHPRQCLYVGQILSDLEPLVIHLTRDVRSVAMTRFYEKKALEAFQRWQTIHSRIVDALRRYDPNKWLLVRYEDLVRSPKAQVARIVEFLGFEYEPDMLEYGRFPHADDRMQLWDGQSADEWSHHAFLRRGAVSLEVLKDREEFSDEVVRCYRESPDQRRLNRFFGYDPERVSIPGGREHGQRCATGELSYRFIFICQQGELELKALLLAASLRPRLQCRGEIVAALPVPESFWGRPSRETLDVLDKLGVHLTTVENRIDPGYPVGNKVSCFTVPTSMDKTFFLDTDILCMRPFFHEDRFRDTFNIRIAGHVTWGENREDWTYVYAKFGLAPPTERFRTSVSHKETLPYYNSGVIGVHSGVDFGTMWLDCCLEIERDPQIQRKRPWLDQIALPIAVRRMGLTVDLLDDEYNFPGAGKPIPDDRTPLFFHYHKPEAIRAEPRARTLVQDLAALHPLIERMLRERPNWSSILIA